MAARRSAPWHRRGVAGAWPLAAGLAAGIALALAPAPARPAAAQADAAAELSAVAGHGGWVRNGTWAPLTITAVSRGDTIAGTLTVHMGGARGMVYSQPLVLPAAARRELQLPVLIEGDAPISVSLDRPDGTQLAAARVNPQPLDETTLLAATLSGDPGAFSALAAARPAAGVQVAVVPLDPIAFPDNPLLLESFDLLVIARLDTTVLRDGQRQALEVWVRTGGTLLVAGGHEWRRTLSGLPEALHPVRVAGAATGPAPAELALWVPPPAGDLAIASGPLAPGAGALLGPANAPLAAVLPAGRGRVVYLAADPTLAPLASWSGLRSFWERLLVTVPLKNQVPRGDLLPLGRTAGTRSPTGAGGVVERTPSLGLPPASAAIGFIAVYLALAGPVTYWALHRRDRREWLWGAVPALALVSVGAVYAGGFGRGQQVVTHLIGVYELVPGLPAAVGRTYVGVYAPTLAELESGLAPGVLISPLPFDPAAAPDADAEPGTPRAADPLVVSPGLETSVALRNLGMYQMGGFTAEHLASLSGAVDFRLTYRGGAVVGQITNGTGQVLRRAVAYTWGAFQQFPDLAPGQTAEVNVPLGDPSTPATGYYMAADRLPLRLADTRQQRLVLEMTLGGGREFDAPPFTFIAWTGRAPDLPGGVSDIGRAISEINLIYARPLPAVDAGRPDLPPGLVRPRLISSTAGMQVVTPGPVADYSLPGGRIVLSFLPPPLDPAALDRVDLHLNLLGAAVAGDEVAVTAYNWQTGAWDPLPPQAVVPLADWRPYLGPGGEVRVEVSATTGVSLRLPTLSLQGVQS